MRVGFRVVGVILVFVLGAFSLYMLRYAYDQGDLKKASRFLYEFKPRGQNKTLVGLMADNLGVSEVDISCDGEILSRYEGRIGVRCEAHPGTQPPEQKRVFLLEVEVVGFQYKALNSEAKNLFQDEI
jgi:hypothetical protein